jgi:hypothetical protein
MMIHVVHERLRAVASGLGQAEWAALTDHAERLEHLVANVPHAVWHKVSRAVVERYGQLEERYGRPTAIAILSAGIAGSAVPVPGTTFVAMAPLIGLAELHHKLVIESGAGTMAQAVYLAESEILHLGKQWVHELAAALETGRSYS